MNTVYDELERLLQVKLDAESAFDSLRAANTAGLSRSERLALDLRYTRAKMDYAEAEVAYERALRSAVQDEK